MSREQEFSELRPLLFSIAYQILGGASAAEDAVQETWLRYDATSTVPRSTKAFLSTTVTRIAIDELRSAHSRREAYVGPWIPEPLLTDPYAADPSADPEQSAALADSVSMAALLLLERLSPLERAVFVLRDVFGFSFAEIADAVGRSEAACRQLGSRARRHMADGRPRFEADRRQRAELADRFLDALRDGDIDSLQELLAADVELINDGGGKVGGPGGVFGVQRAARLLAWTARLVIESGAAVESHQLNGEPGAVLVDRDGNVLGTLSLDILDGRIQTIRSVTNPDKLRHLGPVGDAQAILQFGKRAR